MSLRLRLRLPFILAENVPTSHGLLIALGGVIEPPSLPLPLYTLMDGDAFEHGPVGLIDTLIRTDTTRGGGPRRAEWAADCVIDQAALEQLRYSKETGRRTDGFVVSAAVGETPGAGPGLNSAAPGMRVVRGRLYYVTLFTGSDTGPAWPQAVVRWADLDVRPVDQEQP